MAMNRDLQHRFRLATLAGLGAALGTWLLNGFLRFDGAESIGTGAAGGVAFALVATAGFTVPYLVPDELRTLEAVFSVARRSARVRREAFGDGRVPATPRQAQAWLARHPEESVATRGARVWAYLVLGDLEAAHRLAGQMPDDSVNDGFHRAAAEALVRLVEGGEPGLDDLRSRVVDLDDASRSQAEIDIAVLEALVAAADEGNWRAPILAIRDRLDGAVGYMFCAGSSRSSRSSRPVAWR